jgi:hypothetical protein
MNHRGTEDTEVLRPGPSYVPLCVCGFYRRALKKSFSISEASLSISPPMTSGA